MINVKTFAAAMLVMRHLAAQRAQHQSEDPPMTDIDPNAPVPPAEPVTDPAAGVPPQDPSQPVAPAADVPAAPADPTVPAQPQTAATQTDTTQADATASASDNPFLETATAAAKLIELLRADTRALHFLEALLVCLKPSSDDAPKP